MILSPLQSRHLGTSHSSPNHHQLPCCIFLNLISGLKSLLFKKWWQFSEKPELTGCHIWAVGGLSHLGNLMFRQKTLQEMWPTNGHIVMIKLLLITCQQLWPSESFKQFPRRNVKLNTKFDADSLLYLLCHFECYDHTVHMLTQWRPLPPPTD